MAEHMPGQHGRCPLYDERKLAAHGLRCTAPVCTPLVDCRGSLVSGSCTVPAFMWRRLVIGLREQLRAAVARGEM